MKRDYVGGCHCGGVRFRASADLTQTVICNCSICRKTGTILTFVPAADFKLTLGQDHLADYQFNKRIIHHLFCTKCGIRSFSRGQMPDGSQTVAINVRCLDGVDLNALEPQEYDGASI